jgi:preprotein translocase subunit SecA
MIANIFKKIFGTKNDRELKRLRKVVAKINALEVDMQALTDEQMRAKTDEFKARIKEGESLDSVLPEAFALVREAGVRTMQMRHFDVQMIGGMTLHEGRISEMRTGEGKTLVATLPAYLNALTGHSVHLVTVNDYLATRDAKWMEPLYNFLGLSVGIVVPGQDMQSKRAAYQCDIIYGTNNEFGFDYLRDNMAFALEDKMQGELNFAIVDEVDSILIDEARTPLIISGPAEDSSRLYVKVNNMVPMMRLDSEEEPGHYTVDEKTRSIEMTESGHQLIEDLMVREGLLQEGDSLYAATNLNLLHHVMSALRANVLYHKDVEYIVQEGQVVLIDEHTGRTMPGRRLSEGLHQAIEAKEGVAIQNESQTLASTTFQNFFRLYKKLSGMTGTADTEAFEFMHIYGLGVVVIPTNKPAIRKDMNDLVFLTQEEKFDAIVKDIEDAVAKGAPVLVGTASIETSEVLSAHLNKIGMKHNVLNAKYHAKEAEIVAQAGRPGTVTIATNMAGRGTDIVLGGNLKSELEGVSSSDQAQIDKITADWQERHNKVMDAGGLHIFGTERHESRRIDNQLRGRAGRQGDPGVSRFYLSLDDNLMRIFASERVKNFMTALGMEKGEAIEHRMVSNAIEKAQRKVEGRNFDIRKALLEYDDVANDQRSVIYAQRDDLLEAERIDETLTLIRAEVVNNTIDNYMPPMSVEEQWDIPGLEKQLQLEFFVELPIQEWLDTDDNLDEEGVRERVTAAVEKAYTDKTDFLGDEIRRFEKHIMLNILDSLWKEHLAMMDHLRQGIHLRAYAQKNPKQEYKRESFELFEALLDNIKTEVIRFLARVEIRQEEDVDAVQEQRRKQEEARKVEYQHAQSSALGEVSDSTSSKSPYTREGRKVGRNDPCPCGSGQKFKSCHGKLN